MNTYTQLFILRGMEAEKIFSLKMTKKFFFVDLNNDWKENMKTKKFSDLKSTKKKLEIERFEKLK